MNKFNPIASRIITVLFVVVALSGAFSVLFSAWLAHGGDYLSFTAQKRIVIGLSMQFIHTLLLLILVLWLMVESKIQLGTDKMSVNKKLLKFISMNCFVVILGMIGFSGVLYLKAFHLAGFLSKLAPFGGTLLAFSWFMLAFGVYFRQQPFRK